ncbi:MAG: hypothetical protein JW904_08465 [Spirochaetales bacterium]|nr:hypothetical protein [Spirochaetales bacterium]
MNLAKRFFICSLLFAVAAFSAFADAKGDAAFAKYKDSIVPTYNFLKDYADLRSEGTAIEQAIEANGVVAAAAVMMDELKAAMPEGFSKYQDANPAAKELKLAYHMSYMKSYLEKSQDKLHSLKSGMLGFIKTNVGWMERQDATLIQNAGRFDKIKYYYSVLEVIAKDDEKVLASKNEYLPRAEAAYKKTLELIGEARMPADAFAGKDRAGIEKELADAYVKRTKTNPERIVILSKDWNPRTELVVRKNVVYLEHYLYLAAAVASKEKNGAMVWEISFRKRVFENGTIGPLEAYGFGASYPILFANINAK